MTTVHIPDDLFSELQVKASAAGRTVDELAEEAMREGLRARSWRELVEYGRERGLAAGIQRNRFPTSSSSGGANSVHNRCVPTLSIAAC